ncbi:MAG: hypothetical protein ACIAQF_04040 [Phycisphaerales bacterium JB065]
MTTPMSVTARLLGRLLNPAPALILAGSVSVAPAIVMEARASEEWEFAGFHTDSMHGIVNYTQPSITARDLDLFAQALRLDETQQQILDDAHADFVRAYNSEWTLYAERCSDSRVSLDGGRDWNRLQTRFSELKTEFGATQDRLEDAFLSDLRLLLTADQMEYWPHVERDLRRLKTLSAYASSPDERIDLVVSVQALDLDETAREALRPLLDEYRLQVDAALVARNAKARSLGEKFLDLQARQEEARNPQNIMNMGDLWREIREEQQALVPKALELRDLCSRLSDINQHFRARIEQQLSADHVDAFRRLTTTDADASMNSLFRAGRMLRMLEESAFQSETSVRYLAYAGDVEVQPLTDAQKQQIDQIRHDFESRRDAVLARHFPDRAARPEPFSITLPTPHGRVSLTRRVELRQESNVVKIMNGVPISEELQQEMYELDQETVDRLRQVLTMEQRQLLVGY